MPSGNEQASLQNTKWEAFLCPSCDCIFRINASERHRTAKCPSCFVQLNIPLHDQNIVEPKGYQSPQQQQQQPDSQPSQPLSSSSPQTESPPLDPEHSSTTRRKRKRRKKRRTNQNSAHGKDNDQKGKATDEFSTFPWIITGLLFLLTLTVPALLVKKYFHVKNLEAQLKEPADLLDIEDEDYENNAPSKNWVTQRDLGHIRTINEVIDTAEPVLKNFLEAETVDELISFVHRRSELENKIRAFYKKTPYRPVGFGRIIIDSGANATKQFYSMTVETGDYTKESIAVAEQNDGSFLVDWESWVGHGDLTLEELKESKPTSPQNMRLIIQDTDYYNFQFSDENIWKSYQISTKSSDDVIYGYVKKGSNVHLDIVTQLAASPKPFIRAQISYPADQNKSEQVIINSILGKGWIMLK